MSEFDFYNTNAHRAYPFIETPETSGTAWGDNLFLGGGFFVGAAYDYTIDAMEAITDQDRICLDYIEVDAVSPYVRVYLHVIIDGASSHTLYGMASGTWSAGEVLEVSHASGSSGWVVLGSSDEFYTLGTGTYTADTDSGIIEPSLIQPLKSSCVSSISFYEYDYYTDEPILVEGPLTGRFIFADGYNTVATCDIDNKVLQIEASPGIGQGFVEDWSTYFSGLDFCGEVIRTINGVSASTNNIYNIQAAQFMTIEATGPHELTITIDETCGICDPDANWAGSS